MALVDNSMITKKAAKFDLFLALLLLNVCTTERYLGSSGLNCLKLSSSTGH